jgi:hypothetical protein
MEITLADIRKASKEYLQKYTSLSISDMTTIGNQLNPNEEFTFTINVQNTGGIRLKNVRLKVWVGNEKVAKLVVTGSFLVYTRIAYPNIPRIPDNAKDFDGNLISGLVSAMEITLFNDWGTLDPDEVVTPLTLTGKAVSDMNGGKNHIYAQLVADIDEEYLFPKNRVSNEYSKPFGVVG